MKPLIEVLTSGTAYLAKKGIDESRLNMEHLLAHVLRCRRMDLYLRFDEKLREQDLEVLRELLRRRGEGEPLQHLLGTVEFHDCELICDHRALVPRPETEHLVTLILQRFGGTPPPRVLDVGTGSGCIGLSLTKAWPTSSITLSDISEDALELARMNASRLSLNERVRLLRSDLFEKINGEFELIVANLPYIPRAEIATLSREVKSDPVLALDGGVRGWEIVETFVKAAPSHLAEDGVIAMEVGHDQGETVAEICRANGFNDVAIDADLQGVRRFVFAVAPEKPKATETELPAAA
jgi:release factor glutamine methyltransferase